jgi:hypothetical protein
MFSNHPAYPDATLLSREAAALTRDRTDLATLRDVRAIVASALERASKCDTIHHPDARWSLMDLTELLEGALTDIDGEAERIKRSPLVVLEG